MDLLFWYVSKYIRSYRYRPTGWLWACGPTNGFWTNNRTLPFQGPMARHWNLTLHNNLYLKLTTIFSNEAQLTICAVKRSKITILQNYYITKLLYYGITISHYLNTTFWNFNISQLYSIARFKKYIKIAILQYYHRSQYHNILYFL